MDNVPKELHRGRFKIIKKLGSGGVGSVYLALDTLTKQKVSLKVIHPHIQKKFDPSIFVREYSILADLHHPNLAEIVESGFLAENGAFYFTYLYVEGTPVDLYVKPGNIDNTLQVAKQICEALEYIHSKDVYHLDIKPSNVLVRNEKNRPIVTLLDFGSAVEGSKEEDEIAGTISYLAPERILGEPVDGRADLYSLGILMYRLLTGKVPFSGTPQEIMEQHLSADPVRPRSINPAIPSHLENIILRLLEKRPAMRFAGAGQVLSALDKKSRKTSKLGTLQALIESPRFSGRRNELEKFEIWALKIKAGEEKNNIAFISGEEGAGKTRFLWEIKKRLLSSGTADLYIIDVSHQKHSPLLAAANKAGINIRENDRGDIYSPDQNIRYRAIENISRSILARTSSTPLLLAFDNLESASKMDLGALSYLVSSSLGENGLGIILCGKETSEIEKNQPISKALHITLHPLKKAEAREMLLSMFGHLSISREAELFILEHSQGNPLLIKETVMWLLESGALKTDKTNKNLILVKNKASQLPTSAEDIISRRLKGLVENEETAELLLILASSPSAVTVPFAAEIAGIKVSTTEKILYELVKQGIAHRDEKSFFIPRASVKNAILSMFSEDRVRQAHFKATKVIKKFMSPAYESDLFIHLYYAGLKEKAFKNALTASRHLINSGRFREAAWILKKFITEYANITESEKSQSLSLLTDILITEGSYQEALKIIEENESETSTDINLTVRKARILQKTGKQSKAVKILEPLIKEAKDKNIEIYRTLCSCLLSRGDFKKALEVSDKGLTFQKKDPLLLILKAQALYYLKEPAQSETIYKKALTIAKERGEFHLKIYAQSGLAMIFQGEGRYDEAEEIICNIITSTEEAGDVINLAQAHLQLANLCHLSSKYKEAIKSYKSALEIFSKTGNRPLILKTEYNLANLAFICGAFEEAEERTLKCINASKNIDDDLFLAFSMMLYGLCLEKKGDIKNAVSNIKQCLTLFSNLSFERGIIEAEAELERILTSKERPPDTSKLDTLAQRAAELGENMLVLSVLHSKACSMFKYDNISDKTLEAVLDAISKAEKYEERRISSDLYRILALIHKNRNSLSLAREAAGQAAQLMEKINSELPEEYKDSFLTAYSYTEMIKTAGIGPKVRGRPVSPSDEPTKLGIGKSRYDVFERVISILSRFHKTTDIDDLLEEVLDSAIDVTGAQRGFVLLKDDTGEIKVRCSRNINREAINSPDFEFSRSVVQKVLDSGKYVVTVDAGSDEEIESSKSIVRLKVKSILCLPIIMMGNVEGAVYLDHRKKKGLFDENDVYLAEILTTQASLALERTKMISTLIEKNHQIELLLEELEQKVTVQKIELDRIREKLKKRDEELKLKYSYENIIGKSDKIQQVFKLLDRITDKDVAVYIYGESGTGKELIARAIHYNGPRQDKPFISESCANIPETLFESELFGYVKGAFTGAERDKEGLFEAANGGTLFLDEIGDLPLSLQPKLLRVLQEKAVRRVGSTDLIPIDVRIITASNKNLKELVDRGLFREDLFYRLNVVTVTLPPLRERREDIPLLIDHFMKKTAEREKRPTKKIHPKAMALLIKYDWPGNVRELENEIESLWLLSDEEITPEDLPEKFKTASEIKKSEKSSGTLREMVDELEKKIIIETLKKYKGNKSKAAAELGLSRLGLRKKMSRLGIQLYSEGEPDE